MKKCKKSIGEKKNLKLPKATAASEPDCDDEREYVLCKSTDQETCRGEYSASNRYCSASEFIYKQRRNGTCSKIKIFRNVHIEHWSTVIVG